MTSLNEILGHDKIKSGILSYIKQNSGYNLIRLEVPRVVGKHGFQTTLPMY